MKFKIVVPVELMIAVLFGIFLFISQTPLAFAAQGINAQIPFQGILEDSGGNEQGGDFDMVFRIYDSANGGNTLWTGAHTAVNSNPVSVSEGVFRVMLGSGSGNILDLDFNDDSYYLGITIESDAEMSPRERLGASGYSINSDMIDGLHASAFLLASSTVDADTFGGFATTSFLFISDILDADTFGGADISTFLRTNDTLLVSSSTSSSLLTVMQTGSGDIMNILNDSNEVFTILQNGNVGIGSTTPYSALSVGGEVVSSYFTAKDASSTNSLAGTLEVLSTDVSIFHGGIQTADAIGLMLGDIDHGLTLLQDTNVFGQNDIFIDMRGDAVLSNYVNIAASSTLSFTSNAGPDGWGSWYPSLSLENSGTVRLDNTGQGSVADRHFLVNMSSGMRVSQGGISVTSGGVGVGTSSPSDGVVVVGSISSSDLLGGSVNLTTDASGNIIRDPSDERLKENIKPIRGALKTTLRLEGVSYEWIDKQRFGEQTEIGFVAQDLQIVLPEVVRTGGEYLSVNTRNILGVVVEGIKEMYSEMQEYFTRTEVLEAKVDSLQSELMQLRSELDMIKESLDIQTSSPEIVVSEPVVVVVEQNYVQELLIADDVVATSSNDVVNDESALADFVDEEILPGEGVTEVVTNDSSSPELLIEVEMTELVGDNQEPEVAI